MSPILIALLVVAGSLTYMAGLFWFIAHLTGWNRVARSYVAYHRPEGPTFGMRTLQLGPMSHYGNSINVTLTSEGIYMVPAVLFRVGHAPILLPWSVVADVAPSRFPRTGIQVALNIDGKRWIVYLPSAAQPTLDRYVCRRISADPEQTVRQRG